MRQVKCQLGSSEYLFEKALFYENRQLMLEADELYEQLLQREKLTMEMRRALVRYCVRHHDYESVFFLAKKAIEGGGSLEIFGESLIDAWEQGDKAIADLLWLYKQPGVRYMPLLSYRILQHAFQANLLLYVETVQLYEQVEEQFVKSKAYYELYTSVLLLVVRLELRNGNLPQARFQLRKLLCLPIELLVQIDELLELSIHLDLMNIWYERESLSQVALHLSDEHWSFFLFGQRLWQGQLATTDLVEFARLQPKNEVLARKHHLYILHGKHIVQRSLSEKELTYLKKHGKHWLAVKLVFLQLGEESYSFVEQHFLQHADLPEAVQILHLLKKSREPGKRKPLDGVEVTVLGGGNKIGGTSIVVSVGEHHILLDAGFHLHEEQHIPDFTPMLEKGISFSHLDALIITHAHTDHCAAVPYVFQQCQTLPMYATEETKQLMRVMLSDAVKTATMQEQLYDAWDLQLALSNIQTPSSSFTIPSRGSEWKVTLYPAGHILGAVAVHLVIDEVSILFTGDYSIIDQRTVAGMRLPKDLSVDILITENTYGSMPMNLNMSRKQQEQQLVAQIQEVTARSGNMLIPAFALGRAQEILLILQQHFQNEHYLPFFVYIDGLVGEVSKVYDSFLQPEGAPSLFFGSSFLQARSFYKRDRFSDFVDRLLGGGGNCIIASSGMLVDGSASARYAEKLLPDQKNAIAFSGYLDEESPGYALLQQNRASLLINGKRIFPRAEQHLIRLSAHASREEILQTVLSLNPRFVFLVHGNHLQQYKAPHAEGEVYPTVYGLLKQNVSVPVIPTENGTTYRIVKGNLL